MLKFLIVDDEYIFLESMKMIISRNFDDIEVHTATSGREAIEKGILIKPDVVFMDVQMPGINGIEAIKEIKKINDSAVFVIITAYEFFEYAKEAINLKVFDYILKPVSKNTIVEVTRKVIDFLYSQKKNLLDIIDFKEKLSTVSLVLEEQFISYKVFGIGTPIEPEFYEELFKMKMKSGYVVCILFENKGQENFKELVNDAYEFVRYKLKKSINCLIGHPLNDRLVIYVPIYDSNTIENFEIFKKDSKGVFTSLFENLNSFTALRFKIGIGRIHSINDFAISYEEAYLSALENTIDDIRFYDEKRVNEASNKSFLPDKFLKMLETAILSEDFYKASEIFEQIYINVMEKNNWEISILKTVIIELSFKIENILKQRFSTINLSNLRQEFICNVLNFNDFKDLKSLFIDFLFRVRTKLDEQYEKNLGEIVANVLNYINNNFSKEEITLQEISKNMNVSYHYLSKIFKDEIGKSFVEYLTELRMGKAMQLLNNPNISIKEIAQSVGYNDPNYFSKAFKKVTGLSPTEYRMGKGILRSNVLNDEK